MPSALSKLTYCPRIKLIERYSFNELSQARCCSAMRCVDLGQSKIVGKQMLDEKGGFAGISCKKIKPFCREEASVNKSAKKAVGILVKLLVPAREWKR